MSGSLSQYNEIMRYSFYIDSTQRDSGTNTDLYINTQPITHLSSEGQFIVTVQSISIPFSFYQLSSTDSLNVLPVYLKNGLDVAGRFTTITLNQGNYTPYTLITELNNKLTTACQQTGIAGFTPFTPTFNTTYQTTSGYITFGVTAPANCQITLRFSLTTTTALLGNFFGVGGVDVVMTPATTQSSTKPCVLNPVNYLYLRSSLKQFRNREWVVQKNDTSDILHRIPISTAQGTYIQYDVPSEPVYIVDDSITSINFYLTTNLTYEAINLQQIGWSFNFSISEVVRPKYQPITERIAYNAFAKMTPEDRQGMIDSLEQQKQKEVDRLIRYRDKLKGLDVIPEEKTTETPAVTPTDKTPEELVKDKSALYPTLSKMKEFQLVQYGSVFDESTPRPVGDVLGTLLDSTPQLDEETPSTQ